MSGNKACFALLGVVSKQPLSAPKEGSFLHPGSRERVLVRRGHLANEIVQCCDRSLSAPLERNLTQLGGK